MGIKPIPNELFVQILKHLGLVYKRTEASHELWDLPDNSLDRPVTFRPKDKTIPVLHLHTNIVTLGLTHKEFEALVKQLSNKKAAKSAKRKKEGK